VVHVDSGRQALALFAARFFGEPHRDVSLIGFTGTFGKTSTSDVLRQLLEASGTPTGVIGSLGARYGDAHDPGTGLTTPAPPQLHRMLRTLGSAGAAAVILEVTSHALRMDRVVGLTFSGGLLAAIKSGEHTDFHGTHDDYVEAKRLFLRYLAEDALLAYDADNETAKTLATSAGRVRRAGFSLDGQPADLTFHDIVLDAHGARFSVDGPVAGSRRSMHSALLGTGHLRNVALALTYALGAGVRLEMAEAVLGGLQPLRRRMERYAAAGRTVLDDTAAHPESLRATFEVANTIGAAHTAVVYAVRGMRGADINRRNATALAELAAEYGTSPLIVTPARESAGAQDRVTDDEAEAARGALERHGREFEWHETLRDALAAAVAGTAAGDLLVLVGAQGMNAGKDMLNLIGRASDRKASAPS
jgi:UDP-N-acetylmuramoyl-L-alanyl-D-glutamate--2,6-diaminopimelate ligase